jgi:hypothetical protein
MTVNKERTGRYKDAVSVQFMELSRLLRGVTEEIFRVHLNVMAHGDAREGK